MSNPLYALVPSLIWAFSPIYYRTFMRRFDFLTLNVVRTSMSAAVLVLPALYFGLGPGFYYSLASGATSLALGDTLFLLSIREMGASIAAPVVYTYVLFVQLTAPAIGEAVPAANLVAALMVIAGVYVLSRDSGGRPRARGVLLGLCAATLWTVGQDLIGLAASAGSNVAAIAFGRDFAAAVGLAAAAFATGRMKKWPARVSAKELGFIALISVSDLVVGSFFFVYSIALIGVALTVILTSLSPLLTQVFSRALGKENPTRIEFLGGALIVAALVLAVAV